MKTKIIIMSVFAAFLMTMLPSIQAVEHDTAVEAKEQWIEENIEAIEQLLEDNEAPDGLITTILKWLVKILLIPVKLAIKITALLVRIFVRTTWKLLILPIKLLLLILPPYNFGLCNLC